MAGLRKGRCYNTPIGRQRAYTRKSKYKSKGYIRGIPPSKLIKFDQGNLSKTFEAEVNLISKQGIQIRNNALESARQMVHRHVAELLGNNYAFKVRVYPHQILRENKMLSGAGADRMQTGMQRAFGRPVGTAAKVKEGQAIMTIKCELKDKESAKKALHTAVARLPGKYYIA